MKRHLSENELDLLNTINEFKSLIPDAVEKAD